MKIYNTRKGIIVAHDDSYFMSTERDWDAFINRNSLHAKVLEELAALKADPTLAKIIDTELLPPVSHQEVWAAGVTYLRSREARMEESKDAGGGDFYAKVYEAERPEIFFKAPAYRTVGSGGKVRIRRDSKWNVPEPELTLFICSVGTIEGYTIGNDMSSRDIEGENPLYLPQAKSYDGSTALGPCVFVPGKPIDPKTKIDISIIRNANTVFKSEIQIERMKRKHDELAGFLFRETSFPYGTFLMTGTGIVPPDHFTLEVGDEVKITIEGIGTLTNSVTQ